MSDRKSYDGPFRASLEDALSRIEGAGGPRSTSAFRHGTLEMKVYAPRGEDPQTPHDRDEGYIVMRGSGTFRCSGREEPFGMGDFLFAPAGVEHRFVNFTDDFVVWVLFYGPHGGEAAG